MTKISVLEEVTGPLMRDRKFRSLEVPDEEAERMVETDYLARCKSANAGEIVRRRTAQEIIDEENRRFRNQEIFNQKHYVFVTVKQTNDEGEECRTNFLDVCEDDKSESPDDYVCRMESERRVASFLSLLTETQRRRTIMAMRGMTTREIAEAEGCSHTSVEETIQAVRNKYKKFF